MKRTILHIALMLFATFWSNAQVVVPMGVGLEDEVVELCAFKDGIAAFTVNADSQIEAFHWNGDFWYRLDDPPLPSFGTNTYGILEIKDAKSIGGLLYLLAEHTFDITGYSPNYLLRWDGQEWTALEGNLLNNALEINKLIEYDNTLCLIGIFYDGTSHYNLLRWDGADWDVEGNLITRNLTTDHFRSVVQIQDRVYATGRFTHPASGTMSMVELTNKVWQNASYPAFLTENSLMGDFNGQLVVYGQNSFDSDRIKIQTGNSWESLSGGLDALSIDELNGIYESGNVLYATGTFEDAFNTTYDLIAYEDGSWSPIDLNVDGIEMGRAADDAFFLAGSFTDGSRLKHIGMLQAQRALIQAKVYKDEDGDCIKDANEDWMPNYPLHLNDEIDYLITDYSGTLYVQTGMGTFEVNASDYDHHEATCPDQQLSVDGYREFAGMEFGVRKRANVTDLSVYAADHQSFVYQQGEVKQALICIENPGSMDVQGAVLRLSHGNGLAGFTSERAYDSYQNDVATWTVDLPAEGSLCFYVRYTLEGDEEVRIDVEVAVDGDQKLDNDKSVLKYKQGETLANEKHSDNGSFVSDDEAFMHYKVGFKNLGTDTVVDLMIVDLLDEAIVPSAQGVHYSYSHACKALPAEYTILENGRWQYKYIWEYNDIGLPNTEGRESEGFLDFKVYLEPNTLQRGEDICNMAKIYYSYRKGSFNEAIHTNTVCSQVAGTNAGGGLKGLKVLEVQPIPADGILQIKNRGAQALQLELTNALGQKVIDFQLGEFAATELDVSHLPGGVYMLFAEQRFVQKVVIR